MPAPEEVDEINEFLLKRREKQRLGEIPRDDYTPGFAKKISLAIFGKPRADEKPLLKSTQPTYASSQAQEAMRQQLDEIMESHSASSIHSAYAAPAATKPSAPSPSMPAPKPAVPNYYTNMPYPPYIQRGLATLEKKSSAPISPPAAARSTPITSPLSLPRAASTPPASAARPTESLPLPSARTAPVTAGPPSPVPHASSPFAPPIKLSAPPSTKKPSIPFWKKIFAEKENSSTVSPVAGSTISLSATRPAPYYAPASSKSTAHSSIEAIQPVSSAPHAGENKITPIDSPFGKKTPALNQLPPAAMPSAPAVKTSTVPFAAAPVAPTPVAREPISALPSVHPSSASTAVVSPLKKETTAVSPDQKIIPSANVSMKMSTLPVLPLPFMQPYVPPWVARTMPRSETTDKQSPSTLPWKQPFGALDELNSTAPRETAPISGPKPSALKKLADDDNYIAVALSHEIRGEELESRAARETRIPAISSVWQHDEAVDEEISEEEALEKLPFEDVEGLSASDLDYLSQKEKEHRKAQEEKDGDRGIPSELKNTLHRQSNQLQGVLQDNNPAPPDEKQEILRRLKKMMEEEHQK